MSSWHKRSSVAWALFILSIIGAVAAMGVIALEPDLRSDKEFLVVVAAMLTLVLTERGAAVVKEAEESRTLEELQTLIGALDTSSKQVAQTAHAIPALLSNGGQLITFDQNRAAQEHINAAALEATLIRNTVLRYGKSVLDSPTIQVRAWLEVKASLARTGKSQVQEIVSTHLKGTQAFDRFLTATRPEDQKHEPAYTVKYIDDMKVPMLQFTILTFAQSRDAVYFGWLFGEKLNNPIFLSTNKQLVSFFEDYFEYHWERHAADG